MQMMQQAMAECRTGGGPDQQGGQGGKPPNAKPKESQNTPIKEEKDVRTS